MALYAWHPYRVTSLFGTQSPTNFKKFLTLTCSSKVQVISWGFGYVSSVDDNKIVRIIEMPDILKIMANVFSLRTCKWRSVGHELLGHIASPGMTSEYPISFQTHHGVLVNETLHSIAAYTEVPGRKIIAFDLAHETFAEFPHMDLELSYVHEEDFLGAMGGSLYRCSGSHGCSVNITMWRQPSGEEESISLSTYLCARFCKEFVGFTRTGKFFGLDRFRKKLGLVDPNASPMKYTALMSFEAGRYGEVQFASYVPTLISPFANSALAED